MSQIDKTDRSAYITLGIMFGAAAGLVAGILTAPRSGSETRQQLNAKKTEVQDKATQKLDEKRKLANETFDKSIEKSKQVASRVADTTRNKIDQAADRAKQAADKTDDSNNLPKLNG